MHMGGVILVPFHWAILHAGTQILALIVLVLHYVLMELMHWLLKLAHGMATCPMV